MKKMTPRDFDLSSPLGRKKVTVRLFFSARSNIAASHVECLLKAFRCLTAAIQIEASASLATQGRLNCCPWTRYPCHPDSRKTELLPLDKVTLGLSHTCSQAFRKFPVQTVLWIHLPWQPDLAQGCAVGVPTTTRASGAQWLLARPWILYFKCSTSSPKTVVTGITSTHLSPSFTGA